MILQASIETRQHQEIPYFKGSIRAVPSILLKRITMNKPIQDSGFNSGPKLSISASQPNWQGIALIDVK
jgi:hypothetical protein